MNMRLKMVLINSFNDENAEVVAIFKNCENYREISFAPLLAGRPPPPSPAPASDCRLVVAPQFSAGWRRSRSSTRCSVLSTGIH